MLKRRYSDNTITTYESMIVFFLRFCEENAIAIVTKADVIHFNTNYILARNYSYTHQNQMINALKLYNTFMSGTAVDLAKAERIDIYQFKVRCCDYCQVITQNTSQIYVFEGQYGGKYSDTSARQVLRRLVKNNTINKPGTLHTLRHSYATPLLKNGTDM